jgi:CRISPR/Cas system-associated exonuclease Cas4 (RecB family)
MIDNYLQREERSKDVGRYYPSEIGTCMRKVWYSYKFPVKIQPDLAKIFEVGNIMHDFVVRVLNSEKNPHITLLSTEAPFKLEVEDFLISGRIDDIILVKENGKNVIVEVKSTGNVDKIEEAVHHNRMQLQLYMHVLNIHNGVLLYLDKRNLKSRVFTVEYSEEEALHIVNRFRALHKLLKYEAVPDPEYRASQQTVWMCRNCEYRDKCYSGTPSSGKWL